MQEGGFKLSEADPCMLYKEDEKGVCIIIIYINDRLIIGKEEAIDDAIKVLQGHFQVKDPTSLEDYLGVQIVQSDDGKKAWLGQPTIIKSLETIWRASCKEENDKYTRDTRVYWWKGG